MGSDNFLEIDPNRLDDEWIGQASLYRYWAEKLADARLSQESAKNRVELVKAEVEQVRGQLYLEIASNPDVFGLGKSTDKAIEACIPQQSSYMAVRDQLAEAKEILAQCNHDVGIFDATTRALEHRREALGKLVSLHGQQYFSQPHPDSEDLDVVHEAQKRRLRTRGKLRRGDK